MERVCFLMHLKPDRVTDYLRVHSSVWPEMLDALRETGWTNYSLFLRAEDGLVVGYVETPDDQRAVSEMARKAVNTRWQATMAEYFESGRPDEAVDVLQEYSTSIDGGEGKARLLGCSRMEEQRDPTWSHRVDGWYPPTVPVAR